MLEIVEARLRVKHPELRGDRINLAPQHVLNCSF